MEGLKANEPVARVPASQIAKPPAEKGVDARR
jgi:hypothetical protein